MQIEQLPLQTGASRWTRLMEEIAFALRIHANQTSKGTDIPYISHLLGVASLVLEHDGDEEQAIAALLHDAVEDQGAHQAEAITHHFGERVAAVVIGCTDADTLPKPPWQVRKEAYIAHLEHAGSDVLLVSCADKLHNARAIGTDLRRIGSVSIRPLQGWPGWHAVVLHQPVRRLQPAVAQCTFG